MQKTEVPEDKNIKLISMHDEMSSSYLSYAILADLAFNSGSHSTIPKALF